MKHRGRIIVLGSTKTGESAIVIHALSSGEGRRSFICNVGRKASMAIFQPLNILDCEITDNPKSDLRRIGSITLAQPLASLRSDMYKTSIAMFISEVLYRSVHEGGEDGLFDWLERSIMTLERMDGDFANFHLRFLMELCSQMGFCPSASDLAPFAEQRFSEIQDLLSAPFPEFMLYPLSGQKRNAICSALLDYLGYHIECKLDIRSLAVLRDIF